MLLRAFSSLLLLCAAACGSDSTPTSSSPTDGGTDSSPPTATCEELQKQAEGEMQKAISSHQSCFEPTECTSVAFASDCFDSCSRSIAKTGVQALTDAKNRVNENQCKQFATQGCKLIIPPCEPPSAVTCNGTSCGGG